MVQGVVQHPATVSVWEMAVRSGYGEGESVTWSCREPQTAESSGIKGHGMAVTGLTLPGKEKVSSPEGHGKNKAPSLWLV
jgi:hypothetical protein